MPAISPFRPSAYLFRGDPFLPRLLGEGPEPPPPPPPPPPNQPPQRRPPTREGEIQLLFDGPDAYGTWYKAVVVENKPPSGFTWERIEAMGPKVISQYPPRYKLDWQRLGPAYRKDTVRGITGLYPVGPGGELLRGESGEYEPIDVEPSATAAKVPAPARKPPKGLRTGQELAEAGLLNPEVKVTRPAPAGTEWRWVNNAYDIPIVDEAGNITSTVPVAGWFPVEVKPGRTYTNFFKDSDTDEITGVTPEGKLEVIRPGQPPKPAAAKTITRGRDIYRVNPDGTVTKIQELPKTEEETRTETEAAFEQEQLRQRGRFGELFEALSRGQVPTTNPFAAALAEKQPFRLQDLPGGQLALAQALHRAGQVTPGVEAASVVVPGMGRVSATAPWVGPKPADAGNQTPYQYYVSRGLQPTVPAFSEQRIAELTPAYSQVKALTPFWPGSYRQTAEGTVFDPDINPFGVSRQQFAAQRLGQIEAQARAGPKFGLYAALGNVLGTPQEAGLRAQIAEIEAQEQTMSRERQAELSRPFRLAAQRRSPFYQR